MSGRVHLGTPKTHEARWLPIPKLLIGRLEHQVAGRQLGDWNSLAARLAPAIPELRRGSFDQAAKAIGFEGLNPNELRHTAASLAITSGVSVKVVQRMLGHASATLTLDATATCSGTSSTSSRLVSTT